MSFSERLGLKSSVKEIQLTTIDADLRNGLWNAYLQYVIQVIHDSSRWVSGGELETYFRCLQKIYFKKAIDELPRDPNDNIDNLKKLFYSYDYGHLYDFLEFHASLDLLREVNYPCHMFIQECNRVMELEFAGYRFVERIIVPISNQIEVDEINESLTIGNSLFGSSVPQINMHIKEALSKLSDKKNPDYRNSIKESISAVEALCRKVTGKGTLGEALKELESSGIVINDQLKAGIEKLYVYTNQKGTGIRHALMENGRAITFHEAKFMLVTCSAFINYLIPQVKIVKQ